MQTDLENLIRRRLAGYLRGATSLRDFYRWFASVTWNADKWGNAPLQRLVYGIKLRLAEYSNGHWTREDLKGKLNVLLSFYETTVAHTQARSKSSSKSSSRMITMSVELDRPSLAFPRWSSPDRLPRYSAASVKKLEEAHV